MDRAHLSRLGRTASGVVLPLIAWGAQTLLWPYIPPSPDLLFFPAIVVAAAIGGFEAGSVATVLSTAIIAYSFLPPIGFAIGNTKDALDLGIFAAMSLTVNALMARTVAAKRQAQRANAAKDDIIAMVSHDLKNPVSTIALSARELVRACDTAETPVRRIEAISARIQRCSRRALGLIDRILCAQTGRSRTPPVPTSMAASELVAEAGDYALLASAAHIDLRVEAHSTRQIRCDRDQTMEALGNLLDNAIKFTPPGGTVVARADDVDGAVRFSVSDTGPGIGAAHRKHLFERYWKAEMRAPGTGLGLFIAKQIVESQGGTISVDTIPGQGATFWFTVPAEPASP